MGVLADLYASTALSVIGWQDLLMLAVSVLLLYLGIARKYEPLLLVPIGFGALLSNIPLAALTAEGGLLSYF
ncbi:MAG: sodium ion-translocating decarboxylase subunit beta, partial [Alkalispirochaeta sp.]